LVTLLDKQHGQDDKRIRERNAFFEPGNLTALDFPDRWRAKTKGAGLASGSDDGVLTPSPRRSEGRHSPSGTLFEPCRKQNPYANPNEQRNRLTIQFETYM
jgi:hypothetical protein